MGFACVWPAQEYGSVEEIVVSTMCDLVLVSSVLRGVNLHMMVNEH